MADKRVVIFDWDGTLSDSCGAIVDCLLGASREVGLPELSRFKYSQIIGLGLNEAIFALYPDASLSNRESVASAYRRLHSHRVQTHPPAFFKGAQTLLAGLKADGFLLAVATGKSRQGLDRALRVSGMTAVFDTTRCADETASKPDPKMLFEILTELDVDPSNAFMIGDTVYDLEMAKRAGVSGIGVTFGVHSKEKLLASSPFALVDCLSQVADCLSQAVDCVS